MGEIVGVKSLTDVTTSHTHSLTVEQVLSVIDFEVNRIESEQKRPGWTPWAVYGSIAAALWLLAEQWEKGGVDIINVIQLFLVFSIVRDILHYGKRQLLPPPHRHYELTPRFKFSNESGTPLEMLAYWMRFACLLIISIFLASKVHWTQTAILILFYGFFTLAGSFGFGATYYKLLLLTRHVPKIRIEQNRRITIVWLVILVALAWAMYGHLSYVLRYYPDLVNMSDFRVASLLLIVSFLIPMLVEDSKNTPVLVSLTEIRRDLAFGRIDLNAAIRHADIAISGIPVEDKLQEEIGTVLAVFDQLETEYRRIFSEFEGLIRELPEQDTLITTAQAERAKETLVSGAKDILKIVGKSEELQKLTRGLKLHSGIAEEVAPETVKAAKDVLEKIDSAYEDLEAKAVSLQIKFSPMLERLTTAEERLGLRPAKQS